MDSTTQNPRVVAIHLARVQAHLAEAHRELNRIDPQAFPPEVLKALIISTAQVWSDAQALAALPVIPAEKKPRAKKAAAGE